MSGESSRVKSAWLMAESGGFGVIPDSTGAAGLFIPMELDESAFVKDDHVIIPRNFATGRNKEAPVKVGVGKASFGCKPYAAGYTTSVSTTGNPPGTKQWFDYLLEAVFGSAQAHNAAPVTGSPSTSSLPTSGTLAVGDLAPVLGASTNGGRVQWARISGGASPYTMSPTLAVAPAAADTIYAGRTYYARVGTNQTSQIGSTLAVVMDVDNLQYVMAGSRPNKLALKATAGQAVMWEVGLVGDSRVQQAFSSLPAAPTTDPEPMILRLCSVNVNGVAYDVASIEIDFGLTVVEVRASGGSNARSGWRVVSTRPRIKIDPLNSTAFETLFNAGTTFEFLAQFGDGALTSSHVNSMAFHCELAQIVQPPAEANDAGIVRKSLVIAPVDAGASGASAFYWQLGIC